MEISKNIFFSSYWTVIRCQFRLESDSFDSWVQFRLGMLFPAIMVAFSTWMETLLVHPQHESNHPQDSLPHRLTMAHSQKILLETSTHSDNSLLSSQLFLSWFITIIGYQHTTLLNLCNQHICDIILSFLAMEFPSATSPKYKNAQLWYQFRKA